MLINLHLIYSVGFLISNVKNMIYNKVNMKQAVKPKGGASD